MAKPQGDLNFRANPLEIQPAVLSTGKGLQLGEKENNMLLDTNGLVVPGNARDALIRMIRSAKDDQIPENPHEAMPYLAAVIRAGAGYKKEINPRTHVPYINTPGANAPEVGQLGMTYVRTFLSGAHKSRSMLHTARSDDPSKYKWSKSENINFPQARIAVVGLGATGMATVADANKMGIGMIYGFDPKTEEELDIDEKTRERMQNGTFKLLSLEQIANLPENEAPHCIVVNGERPDGTPILTKEILDQLHPETAVILMSRFNAIDHEALLDNFEKSRLWYAADVHDDEGADNMLKTNSLQQRLLSNLRVDSVTEHGGGNGEESKARIITDATKSSIQLALTGFWPNPYAINLRKITSTSNGGGRMTSSGLQIVSAHQNIDGMLRDLAGSMHAEISIDGAINLNGDTDLEEIAVTVLRFGGFDNFEKVVAKANAIASDDAVYSTRLMLYATDEELEDLISKYSLVDKIERTKK